MYEELVKELRENASNSYDIYIADAIEDLLTICREQKAIIDGLNQTIKLIANKEE